MSRIEAERLNKEGIALLQQEKLEEASRLFLRAIEADASYAFPYSHIGNILAAAGKPEEARSWFQKSIELDGDMATAYYGLGSVLYDMEKWSEAIATFELAEKKGLVNGDLYFMLGMSYEQAGEGNFSRALAYFQLALDQNADDLEARFHRGFCSAQLGHLGQAKADFLTVLESNPNHADAHYNLAVIYAYEEDKPKVVHHLDQAISIQPNHLLALHARKQLKGE